MKTPKLYVAVIYTPNSGRHEGDLSSFVDTNKSRAVSTALKAKAKWEAKGYGPYTCLVGALAQEAKPIKDFTLEPIGA